jgi:hypothetical protein
VTRPGGYVAVNGSFFTEVPAPEVGEMVRRELGVDIPVVQTWQTLWKASGLRDRVVRLHQIDARREIRNRLHGSARGGLAFGLRSISQPCGQPSRRSLAQA